MTEGSRLRVIEARGKDRCEGFETLKQVQSQASD